MDSIPQIGLYESALRYQAADSASDTARDKWASVSARRERMTTGLSAIFVNGDGGAVDRLVGAESRAAARLTQARQERESARDDFLRMILKCRIDGVEIAAPLRDLALKNSALREALEHPDPEAMLAEIEAGEERAQAFGEDCAKLAEALGRAERLAHSYLERVRNSPRSGAEVSAEKTRLGIAHDEVEQLVVAVGGIEELERAGERELAARIRGWARTEERLANLPSIWLPPAFDRRTAAEKAWVARFARLRPGIEEALSKALGLFHEYNRVQETIESADDYEASLAYSFWHHVATKKLKIVRDRRTTDKYRSARERFPQLQREMIAAKKAVDEVLEPVGGPDKLCETIAAMANVAREESGAELLNLVRRWIELDKKL